MDCIQKGDERMLAVFNRWQDDLTTGIIGLANIFDPDCVVLSGSMAQFVDTKKIEEIVNQEIVTTPTSIRKGIAGNYSGMIGVALLAMERSL